MHETKKPEEGFDRFAFTQEPLPEGMFAADVAASVIPEIQACAPSSVDFAPFFARALNETRSRHFDSRAGHEGDILDGLGSLDMYRGYEAAMARIALSATDESANYADENAPDYPDPDLYEVAVRAHADATKKADRNLPKMQSHAEITPISYTDGAATFVAITHDGRCVYGIGSEELVTQYLTNGGYLVNNNWVGGIVDSELRPNLPDIFGAFSNVAKEYLGPVDGGEYVDVAQQVSEFQAAWFAANASE